MLLSMPSWAVDPNCCCTPHASTSCSDPSCSTTVCAIDPYCCNQQWDGACAYEASVYCGAAAPYCLDQNQNNVFDVCENGGGNTNAGDCNNNGTPDLNEVGYNGISQWTGPTSGSFRSFENPQWWSLGRPGTATIAAVNLPYTQYYSGLHMLMGCDNAVRTFQVSDGGTSSLHDLVLDLGGRTLRVAGAYAGFELHPNIYDTLRLKIASGDIMATDNGLYVVDEGALEVRFDSVQINGGAFGWNSSLASASPTLIFENSALNTTFFSWPSAIQGVTPYPTLELKNSTIQFASSTTGGSIFSIPNGAFLHVNGPGSFDLAQISGSNLQVFAEAGSLLSLDGRLTVGGTLNLAGSVIGRSHCLPQSQFCTPSVLTATTLVYPTPGTKASLTWGVDLSGASGTTPDGDASIRATAAWIDGTLIVNDLSNGNPPALDFSVPLVRASTYSVGHDNFDLVRAYGVDFTPLPAGYFVTTERLGDKINLVVKRSNPVASNSPVNATLTTTPTKMAVIDDGSRFGLPLVAYATPPATQGSTTISLRKVNASQGTVTPFATIYAPADLTDMITADLNGDGAPELVASFGSAGQVRAYSISTQPTLLWTRQFAAGVRAECLCELKPAGQRLMPVGSSVGVGTSSGSKGSVGTLNSTGEYTDAGEIAVIPRTVNGTDVDNDDDSDVVAGGESTAASLVGSATGAIQIIRREVTGGFTKLPSVAVPGIPSALAVADLDGDGRKDVVASCNQITGSFSVGQRPTGVVLRGAPTYGNGSSPSLLRAPAALDVGSSYAQGTGVSLIDADADGFLDIALSWQDTGSATSGGAAVFPVRDQRASGGLSLGGQLNFATNAVSQLKRLKNSSVITLRTSQLSLTNSTALVQDDFAAAPVEGDLDGDGFVTNADIALLLLDFGPCTGQPCEGDLDGTGAVDNGDLAFMLLLFS